MANERAGTSFKGGSRFYTFDDGVQHPGVTSILNQLPKPFLVPWASKISAEWAMQHLSVLNDLAGKDEKAGIELIKTASKRSTSGSAELGTRVHEFCELTLLGDAVEDAQSEDEANMRDSFRAFLKDWSPEVIITEATVRNDTTGYAGSLDAILNIGGTTVVCDWKTGRSLHSEVGLQCAAYRYAEQLGNGDPMPVVEGAAVLHITAKGYALHPVKAGPEQFEVFKHLRAIFDWSTGGERGVIGKALDTPA
jgi:hypothetical protein